MSSIEKKSIHFPCCFSIKVKADTFEKIKTIKGLESDLIGEIRTAIEAIVNTKWQNVESSTPQAD